MYDALLKLWASSPTQTAHLTSALPGAPVVTPAERNARHRVRLVERMSHHRAATAVLLAVVVLTIGVGGTAGAVSLITGKQIKDGTVRSRDVGNGSLTGADVADKSLSPADFSGSVQGPAGPSGPQGPQGPQGDPGVPGVSGLQVVTSPNSIISQGQDSWIAECPVGLTVLAGGVWDDGAFGSRVMGSRPYGDRAWLVAVVNERTAPATVTAYAMCARVD